MTRTLILAEAWSITSVRDGNASLADADIPRSARIAIDMDRNRVVVDICYATPQENWERGITSRGFIGLSIGSNSKRLWRIEASPTPDPARAMLGFLDDIEQWSKTFPGMPLGGKMNHRCITERLRKMLLLHLENESAGK